MQWKDDQESELVATEQEGKGLWVGRTWGPSDTEMPIPYLVAVCMFAV